MSVFVFQIEKVFDLFSLPKDDENVEDWNLWICLIWKLRFY